MGKVHVGVVAYGFDDDFFRRSLQAIEPFFDCITIVYGAFWGFNVPEIEIPSWLKDLCGNDKFRIFESHKKHRQNRQRDIYLDEITPGDLLFIMDSDFMIGGDAIEETIDALKAGRKWDASLISVRLPDGSLDQKFLGVYRYRLGWIHSVGQILEDAHGQTITSPYYRIREIDADDIHWVHHRISDSDPEYRAAQRRMWQNRV